MDLQKQLRSAVSTFWHVRTQQHQKQGSFSGVKDAGNRAAVTGGKHCDGFSELVCSMLLAAGVPTYSIHAGCDLVTLPGYYRPTKEWDLVVVSEQTLLAVLEFKSQVGPSFGNNFNNRTEESLGNAVDIRHAYREGAFSPSAPPWLGYFMLLEDCPGSTTPVKVKEPHFKVFPEFRRSSYAKRYELLLQRLVRERHYDAACLILSPRDAGLRGSYSEPSAELSFYNFAASLTAHANAFRSLTDLKQT